LFSKILFQFSFCVRKKNLSYIQTRTGAMFWPGRKTKL